MKKLNRPTNLENPGVIEHEKITRPTNPEKNRFCRTRKKIAFPTDNKKCERGRVKRGKKRL